jgi:predicted MPP superfamily phosphohydrolase
VLLHLYVFGRACSLPHFTRRIRRQWIVMAGLLLCAAILLANRMARTATGPFGQAIELLGITWLVVLFLTATALLAVDVVTGFGFLLRPVVPALRGWAFAAGGMLSLIALVQGLRPPVMRSYEVRLAGLPAARDGTVIVAMSDLHLGSLLGVNWLAARLAQVRAQRPDIVVLLGDVVDRNCRPTGQLLAEFRRLSAPLGVWAVTGNHESYGGRDAGVRLLKDAGFRLLHDAWAEVCSGLTIAGVDDLSTRHRHGRADAPVAKALTARPPGATVFLSHVPWQARQAAEAGVGLMLSGHTHGGQVWPFAYLNRLRYPLSAGRYDVCGMTVIVCRGTGTWGTRMRLWRPSEILRVTLRAP